METPPNIKDIHAAAEVYRQAQSMIERFYFGYVVVYWNRSKLELTATGWTRELSKPEEYEPGVYFVKNGIEKERDILMTSGGDKASGATEWRLIHLGADGDSTAESANAEEDAPMGASMDVSTFRMSGGELPEKQAHTFRSLRSLIKQSPDVQELLALGLQEDGTWLYLIKTTFSSYPKYVIGETDVNNTNPTVILKCGNSRLAWEEWNNVNAGGLHP